MPLLASEPAGKQMISFDIPRQRADLALTAFAEQADLTLVFPDELVREKHTNALIGEYTLREGAQILLDGTGLTPEFSNEIVMSIATDRPSANVGDDMSNLKKAGFLSAVAALFTGANAQESGVADRSNERSDTPRRLEEIIVTATHRAESLQDIPVAVTALSGEMMEAADIFDAYTISQHTPGFAYAEFAPGQANLAIRGIGSADDGAGLDNSVAVFLDGVYIGRQAGINFDMFDIERIEVLRGPQGTLFGRNSIAGAVNVITRKPTDELEGKIGATVGNEGILRYQAYVSGPLSDTVSGKFVVNHREHDGFVDNLVLNKKQQNQDQTSFRGALRFSLDSSEWTVTADYSDDDRDDMGRTPVVDNAPLSIIQAQNGVTRARQNTSSREGFSMREIAGLNLTGEIEFDRGTLTSITGYRQVETDWEMLSVGAPLGGLGLPFDEVVDDIVEEVDTLSQEFRWTSSRGGIFEYTAGVYFFTEDTDRTEIFRITRAGSYDDPMLPFRITDVGDQAIIGNEYARTANETTSFAVYAEGTWDLNDAWRLTAGGRFTQDSKDYTAESVNCALVAANDPSVVGTRFENFAPCGGVGGSLNIIAEAFLVTPSDDWTDFSPKVAVQYRPNDSVMWFGSVSKGFKSGGFAGSQGVESAASTPVDQETAWNYEFGLKGDFFDNTLRFNTTVFYTDYQDLQIVRFGPVQGSTFGTFITANIGEADITGVETEFSWYPTDNFSIEGHYGFLDSEVNDLVIPTAGGDVDVSGKTLNAAPEHSANVALVYDYPTAFGQLNFRFSYTHIDDHRRSYTDDRIEVDAADLLDLSVGWQSDNGDWKGTLWAKNITDEDYISHLYVIGPGGIGVWGPPRTYGLTVSRGF